MLKVGQIIAVCTSVFLLFGNALAVPVKSVADGVPPLSWLLHYLISHKAETGTAQISFAI